MNDCKVMTTPQKNNSRREDESKAMSRWHAMQCNECNEEGVLTVRLLLRWYLALAHEPVPVIPARTACSAAVLG